jgi:hypothetical protein
MTTSHEATLDESKRRHQREVLRYIVLPLLGGALLIALIILVVVLLPFSIGLMTLAIISGRAHPVAAKPLRRGEALTLKMRERASNILERGARASIAFNARLVPMTRWMNRAFDRPALPAPKQDDGEEK